MKTLSKRTALLLGMLAATLAIRADMSIDAPATAYDGIAYQVTATEDFYTNDDVYIDKDGNFFYMGWTGSASDWSTDYAPATVHFEAYSTAHGNTDEAYVDVVFPNRAPEDVTIDRSSSSINLGSTVTISSTAEDPDGNMSWHDLLVQPPGGGSYVARSTSGTGWSSNSNTPPNPSNSSSSSISGVFTPSTTGTWNFKANAYDGEYDGNQPTTSVSVVDGTAPSAPTGLNVTNNTTGSSFTLNWSASSDNVGVTGYEVERGTTSLGNDHPTPSTSRNVTGLDEITTYAMKVRARDAAGNWSSWSSTLNVTTADVTAPSIPSSISGSSVGTSSFTLNWGNSTDNIAVTGYEVQLDSTTPVSSATNSKGFSGLSSGTTYAMRVRARDAAANWSSWSSAVNVQTHTSGDDSDSDGILNGSETILGTGELTANSDGGNSNALQFHFPTP